MAHEDLMDAPPDPSVTPVQIPVKFAKAKLTNITVLKADGRVIDLGRPGTYKHRWRMRRYNRALENELTKTQGDRSG